MSAEKLRELKTLASVCPELNMANYGEDDVRHLNDWAIEMSLLVEQYALSQQPAQATPVCGAQNAESAPQAPLSLTAAPQQATPDDMKVYASIADRYFREATQAEVTEGVGDDNN